MRTDLYLVLNHDGVELHFALSDAVTPTSCLVHVADAAKLPQQLHDEHIEGVGDVRDEDYGLREFG